MLNYSVDRSALKSVLVYITLIFGLWIVYVSFLYPYVESRPNLAARIFLNEIARTCIFVTPVFLYLKCVSREEPLRFLKLRTRVSRGVLWGTVAAVAYGSLVLARAALIKEGGINPKPVPIDAWFTSLTLSTLIEEIAFRGFILQKLEQVVNFWVANVITSCLFVAIHFPGWIIVGRSMLVPDKLIPMGEIFLLGLLLGYLLKRTISLWSCIILHAINNLVSIVVFS